MPQFLCPYRKPPFVPALGPMERAWNRRVKRLRWRVEDVFADTKKWGIFKLQKRCGHNYSHDTLYGMWCLAGILHNEWITGFGNNPPPPQKSKKIWKFCLG